MVEIERMASREYPHLPPTSYVGEFKGIRMEKDNGNGPFFSEKDGRREYYCWAEFIINGETLSGSLPLSRENGGIRLTPKNKSTRFVRALLGRELGDDEDLNTNTLIGRKCLVAVEDRKGKDGNVRGSKIVEFMSLPKQQDVQATIPAT